MKNLMFAVALMQVMDLAAVELPPFRETPFDRSRFCDPWRGDRAWGFGQLFFNACSEAGIVYQGNRYLLDEKRRSSSEISSGEWQRGRRQSYFYDWDMLGNAGYQYDENGLLVSLCAFGDTEKGRAITNRLDRERLKACDKLASKYNLTRQEMEKKYEEIRKQELAKWEKNQSLSRASVDHSHDDKEEFVGDSQKRDQCGLLDSDWRKSPWCEILNVDIKKKLRNIQSNEVERCGSVLVDSSVQSPSWFRTSGKNLIDRRRDGLCCKFDRTGRLVYAGPFELTEEAQRGYAACGAFAASNRLEWAKGHGMTVDEAEKGYKAYVKRKNGIEVLRRRGCGCQTLVHLDPDSEFERKLEFSQERQEKSKANGMAVDRWEWESGPWAYDHASKGVEFLAALSNVCERFKFTYVGTVIDMAYQDVVAVSNFCREAGELLKYAGAVSWTNGCGRSLLVAEENWFGGMAEHLHVCRYDSEGCLVWRGRLEQTEEWQAIEKEWKERKFNAKSAWAKKHGLTTAMCDWISRVGYDKWAFEAKTDEFIDETNDVNSVFGVRFSNRGRGNYSHSESLRQPVKWFNSTPMVGVRKGGFQTLSFSGSLPKDMAQDEIDRGVARLKQLLTAKWGTPHFVENEEALYHCGKPLAVCISVKDNHAGTVKDVRLMIAKNDKIANGTRIPYECRVQLVTGGTLLLVVDEMRLGKNGSWDYYLDGKCRLSVPNLMFGGYSAGEFVDDGAKSLPIRVESKPIIQRMPNGAIQICSPQRGVGEASDSLDALFKDLE